MCDPDDRVLRVSRMAQASSKRSEAGMNRSGPSAEVRVVVKVSEVGTRSRVTDTNRRALLKSQVRIRHWRTSSRHDVWSLLTVLPLSLRRNISGRVSTSSLRSRIGYARLGQGPSSGDLDR